MAALDSQSGISKSQVSRICQEIDQQFQAFLSRPLEIRGYADVYLDATYLKGRLGKALQACSRAVVAMGVNADGRRELLGIKVGDSESGTFWAEFIASPKERGLTAVRLVVSDAHVGLSKARGTPSAGSWRAASGSAAGCTLPATCRSGCPSRKAFSEGVGPPGHGHRRPALGVRPGLSRRDHEPLG